MGFWSGWSLRPHMDFSALWVTDSVIQMVQRPGSLASGFSFSLQIDTALCPPLIVPHMTRPNSEEKWKSNFFEQQKASSCCVWNWLLTCFPLCSRSHSPPEPPTPRCKLSAYSAGLSTKLRHVCNSLSLRKNSLFDCITTVLVSKRVWIFCAVKSSLTTTRRQSVSYSATCLAAQSTGSPSLCLSTELGVASDLIVWVTAGAADIILNRSL